MARCHSRSPHPIGLRPQAGFGQYCEAILNRVLIILNSRNCFKLSKFIKLVGISKNYKINFVGLLLNDSTHWLDQTQFYAVNSCTKL
jgi:hypothetical protein